MNPFNSRTKASVLIFAVLRQDTDLLGGREVSAVASRAFTTYPHTPKLRYVNAKMSGIWMFEIALVIESLQVQPEKKIQGMVCSTFRTWLCSLKSVGYTACQSSPLVREIRLFNLRLFSSSRAIIRWGRL